MVRAVVRFDENGLLRDVRLEGHAGLDLKGSDIVCAAITALVRSAAKALDSDGRFEVSGEATEPGRFTFEVTGIGSGGEEYLMGVSSYLVLGLSDIASEYPDRCMVEVRKGAFDGA